MYRVELKTATFGVVVSTKNGITKITDSAPFGRFMIGWSLAYALHYVAERGGTMTELK